MSETIILKTSFQKVFKKCIQMGCERLSVIKKTKQGRLHINITPLSNGKTEVKIHHDISLKTSIHGHYSKSNDPVTKKFLSDLKKEIK